MPPGSQPGAAQVTPGRAARGAAAATLERVDDRPNDAAEPVDRPAEAAGNDAAASVAESAVAPGRESSALQSERPVPPLWAAVAVYTAIRVGLVVVLTAALWAAGLPFGMPPIVALAFAIVLQLPLSIVFFRRARSNLTAALARAKSSRTAERDRLHAELTGEDRLD